MTIDWELERKGDRLQMDKLFTWQNSTLQGSKKVLHSRSVQYCAVNAGIFTVHTRYVSMSIFVPTHESSLSGVLSENLGVQTATHPLDIIGSCTNAYRDSMITSFMISIGYLSFVRGTTYHWWWWCFAPVFIATQPGLVALRIEDPSRTRDCSECEARWTGDRV